MGILPSFSLQADIFQQVTDLLVAITALLGGLSTIYTLLRGISQNKNKPKEASPLQFIRVEHQPVERQDWQRRRRMSIGVALGCLLALVGYSLLLFLRFPPRGGDEARIGFYLVFVVVLTFNLLGWSSIYLKLGKRPEDARTFFFQSATVEVNTPAEAIFAECLRAIKQLSSAALEFDAAQQYIEATLGMSVNSLGGTLCIQIEQKSNTVSCIHIEMKRRFLHHAFANSSWAINSFITQLLGK